MNIHKTERSLMSQPTVNKCVQELPIESDVNLKMNLELKKTYIVPLLTAMCVMFQ